MATIIFSAVLALAAGCGGGGGGDDDPPSSPTPTPTPSASATAAPTTTPSPFPEVALAAGVAFSPRSGFVEGPFVLRNDGDGWERIAISAPRSSYIAGFVFSAPEVVWGFGFTGEEQAFLVRSDDAGRSWVDVSTRLPADFRRIVDLTFVDDTVGYAMSRGIVVDRRVFKTDDAGLSWSEVPAFARGAIPSTYALEARGTAVELVRSNEGGTSDGLVVGRVDDPSLAPVQLSAAGGVGIFGLNAFSVAGLRGWVAATAAIFASDAPGDDWTEETIALGGQPELRAIDVRDVGDGVAGGNILANDGRRTPLLLVMSSDGRSWEPSVIVDPLDGFTITDVLRLRGDTAWASATDITSGTERETLLRSDDGGRTWRRDSVLDGRVQINDLARNTTGH